MTNELKSESRKPNVPHEETKQTRSERNDKPSFHWYSIRLFPIWLRIVIVLILLIFAASIGLIIGYGVIGDGKPIDALKWETWQHIFDIVNGKE